MKSVLCDHKLVNEKADFQTKNNFLENRRKIEPCQFSSNEFIFKPIEEDWKIVNKNILTVMLYLTDKCNLNCKICYERDSSNIYRLGDINHENLIKILSYIGKNKKVILFGGEPTMRNDIFKIIKEIKKSGNFVELYTNGLKLCDLNYVKKLKKAGIEKVYFSFDGFNEYAYSFMRNNPHYLQIKLKALKNLEKCSINVTITSTIARGINDDQIPYLLMFAISNKHFIKGLTLLGLTPFNSPCNIKSEYFMTVSDILEILERRVSPDIKKYYKEFEKFKINLNEFLNKIGIKNFPFSSAGMPFKIHHNRLEELISFKDLKEINKNIENGKIIEVLKYFIRNFDLKYLSKVRRIPRLDYELEKNDVMMLHIFNLITPLNYIPMKRDTVTISEKDNEILFLSNGGVTT